jgi:hypothetical protein
VRPKLLCLYWLDLPVARKIRRSGSSSAKRFGGVGTTSHCELRSLGPKTSSRIGCRTYGVNRKNRRDCCLSDCRGLRVSERQGSCVRMVGTGSSTTRRRSAWFAHRCVATKSSQRPSLERTSAHDGPDRRSVEVSNRYFFAELKRRNVYKVATGRGARSEFCAGHGAIVRLFLTPDIPWAAVQRPTRAAPMTPVTRQPPASLIA